MKIELPIDMGTLLSNLQPGNTFLQERELYIATDKYDEYDWYVVNLANGKSTRFSRSTRVIPINIKVVEDK